MNYSILLLIILLLCIAPITAEKNKGLFSGDILQADLDAFTSNTSDTPSFIEDVNLEKTNIQEITEWIDIGKTQLKIGNWAAAEEAFSKVTLQNPSNDDGWEGYLLAIRGGGDFDRLLAASEDATEKNPEYSSAWKYRGIALSGLDRSDEALAAFDKVLVIDPSYYQAWYYKGIAYDNLKQYEEALNAYEEVLKANPEYSKAWNNKGVTLNFLGRYDEAITAFEKAIAIDPTYKTASNNKDIVTEVKRKKSLGSLDIIDDSSVISPLPEIESDSVSAETTISPTTVPTQISTPDATALPANLPKPTPTYTAPCNVYKTDIRSGELKEGEAILYGYFIPSDGRTNIEWILQTSGNQPIFDLYAFKDCNPKDESCNTEFFAYGPDSFISIDSPTTKSTYYLMIYARLGSGTYHLKMNSYQCLGNRQDGNILSKNSEKGPITSAPKAKFVEIQ